MSDFENSRFMQAVEEIREKELCIADGLVVVAKSYCDRCHGAGITEVKREDVQANGDTYITYTVGRCECATVHPKQNVLSKFDPPKTVVRVKP
jgi:hypothetical protein